MRARGFDPGQLSPAEREVGAMIDRVGRKGWGLRDKTRHADIELSPRKLAAQARKRQMPAAVGPRAPCRAWSERTYRATISQWVARGWLMPTRRKRNQPRRYAPVWWTQPPILPTGCRLVADSLPTDLPTGESANPKEISCLDPVVARTGRGIRLNELDDGRKRLTPTDVGEDGRPKQEDPTKPFSKEIAAKLSEAKKEYPGYAGKFRERVASLIRGGTPEPVILRALDRLLHRHPHHPIGYFERIVRSETPNYMERLSIQESDRRKRETPKGPRGGPVRALAEIDSLKHVSRWAEAHAEINAAFRQATEDADRQAAIADCGRTYDLDRLRSLVREWNRPKVDFSSASDRRPTESV